MTTEPTSDAPPLAAPSRHERLPEHDIMGSLIGKWMTVGATIPIDDDPVLTIHASDIYEWVAGRFFVVHTAYGRIGDVEVAASSSSATTLKQGTTGPTSSTPRGTSATRTSRSAMAPGPGPAITHEPSAR
jgi:hypothetical protein